MKFNTLLISILVLGLLILSYFSLRRIKQKEFMYGYTKDEIALKFYNELKKAFFDTVKMKLDRNYQDSNYDLWRSETEDYANIKGISYEDAVLDQAQYLWEIRKDNNIYPDYEYIVRIFNGQEFAKRCNYIPDCIISNRSTELSNRDILLNEIFYNI